jgi:two-component system, LytTR family, response regulator
MKLPPIRTLLVDDDSAMRLALRQALAPYSDGTVIGECSNAADALRIIERRAADLVFLDIYLPGMDGFKLLRSLRPETLPMVVFPFVFIDRASHPVYLGEAHAMSVRIHQGRFAEVMVHVRERWQGLCGTLPKLPLMDAESASGEYAKRLRIRTLGRTHVIGTAEIDWIRAQGDCVHVHAGGAAYLHRETLRHLLDTLDPKRFVRIHRGTLVNVERIRELPSQFAGNAHVVLRDGTRLGVSRRFHNLARNALQRP